MKNWIVPCAVIAAIFISCLLYNIKFDKRPTDMEIFSSGLADIHKYVSPYTHIGVKCNYGDRDYYGLVTNYALFPIQTDMARNYDTILYVFPQNVTTEDTLFVRAQKRKLIWQNKNRDILYILTSN